MNNIKKNQLQRKKNKEKRKKQSRRLLVIAGLVVSISSSVALISLSNRNNVNADTARPLSTVNSDQAERKESESRYIDSTEEIKDTESELETKRETKTDTKGFRDEILGYKVANQDINAIKEIETNSDTVFEVKTGQYVKFLGQEDGWSKISYNNILGYVESSKLDDTKENELVVKKGILLASKKYLIPEDFSTKLSIEAENAMMVMFEAIQREGLEIGVSKKHIEYDEDINQTEEEYNKPNRLQDDLRTDKSVEFNIPNKATAVDFAQTKLGKWLEENSYNYGFVQRYPSGKEHKTGFISNDRIYSYVGTEIAKEIHDKDLTLEEYFN